MFNAPRVYKKTKIMGEKANDVEKYRSPGKSTGGKNCHVKENELTSG